MVRLYGAVVPYLLLSLALFFGDKNINAQDFRITQHDLVSFCQGNLVDGGGQAGQHTVGSTESVTICSDSPAPNSHISLAFDFIEIEGILTIYNNDNSDDPADILTVFDNTANGAMPTISATAGNLSGCLTIVFEGTAPSAGWLAAISCIEACQVVEAGLFFTDPEIMPVDTGYIDVCLGDTVTFIGGGVYPENGAIYAQDDATSTLEWSFTDGFTSDQGTIQRVFDQAGGYILDLKVTDVIGCESTNRLRQRIRVAPRPAFNLQTDLVSEVCTNDTIVLVGSTETDPNPSSEVFVDSDSVSFPVGLEFADTTFLPDGTGPTAFYQTSLEFANFDPGATLTDLGDLIEICLNMEHSYAGDLDVFITCPNGSEVTFIDDGFSGLTGQFFGEPIDIEGDLSPGVGYDYCFVPDPGLPNIGDVGVTIMAGEIIPAMNYGAESSWDALVGCPLNGSWTISVQDNLLFDNGYIFSWSIQFADYLYPSAERFKVGIEDKYWVQQDNMFYYEPDSIRALAVFSGINAYTYEVVDSFGCVYDTTLTIEVNPFFDPACDNYECQPLLDAMLQEEQVCEGSEVQTTLATREFLDTLVPWAAFPYARFRNGEYPTLSESFGSVITVENMLPLTISDASFTIESVCVDIETEAAGDIRLFLVSPAGSLFELSSGNGGGDPNFTNTCFTPDAITPIQAGTAPFSGDFLPETDFSFLNGAPLNGDWTIRAWDIAGGNAPGEFLSWSITFRYENEITYSWLPDDGTLSCTDCPNPIISPTGNQVYTVSATDQFGCTESGMVDVTVVTFPPQIEVIVDNPPCIDFDGADATVDLDPNGGFSYNWSHGPTTRSVTDLDPGDYTVTITLGPCEATSEFSVVETFAIQASINEVEPVSCNGGSDGQIDVNISGGNGELTFAWDDPNLQVLEDAVFLDAGTYTLTIMDENGCEETIAATVTQPDPLELSFGVDDVDCNGDADGSATVSPQGGNGNYVFNWETGSEDPTITDVTAGTYSVTITDLKGCQIVDSISVSQPAEAVSAQVAQDQMGCFESSLNIATVDVAGGQMPYEYSWPNGVTTATAENLSAGLNVVTVTDANGCELTREITLTDLAPISFNLFASDPTCNGFADGGMGLNQLTGGAGLVDEDYSFLWSTGSTEIVASNLVGGLEYSLTVTDQQGCAATESRFLDDPEPVEITVGNEAVSCFGFSDGSASVLTISSPNSGGFDIQWGPATNNAQDSTVTGLPAGIYTVEVTDQEGCQAAESLVISEPSAIELELAKVDAICFGDVNGSIQTSVAGGTPEYEFSWSNGQSLANLDNLPAGNYQLILNDANGCEEIREIEITQPEEVVATATSEAAICNGDATGTVIISATGGNEPYVYGLQNTGLSARSEFIGLPAGDYDVVVRDTRGCQGRTEITVEDGPDFTVDLGDDINLVFGDSTNFNPMISGAVGELIYAWSGSYDGTLLCFGDSTDRAASTVVFCPDPNVKPEYEIDYRLLLIDENGCEAEDRIRVSIEKIRVVEVPQGFTPNNDGQNDRLIVHGRPGTTVKRFSVFNRWGELVYEDADFPVNDPNRGWDGNYKAEALMGGVYLWQVEVIFEDDSVELLTGQTSLLR